MQAIIDTHAYAHAQPTPFAWALSHHTERAHAQKRERERVKERERERERRDTTHTYTHVHIEATRHMLQKLTSKPPSRQGQRGRRAARIARRDCRSSGHSRGGAAGIGCRGSGVLATRAQASGLVGLVQAEGIFAASHDVLQVACQVTCEWQRVGMLVTGESIVLLTGSK